MTLYLCHVLLWHARPQRSQNPPPMAQATPSLAAHGAKTDHVAQAEALVALYPDTVPAPDRETILGEASEKTLLDLGAAVNPTELFADVARAFTAYAPWILRGRLGTYGPMRARIVAETMRDVAPLLSQHVTLDAGAAAPKPATKPARRAAPRLTRREALKALNQHASSQEARDAIEQAVTASGATSREAREQRRTIAKVAWVRAHVSATMRADTNLTADVLDELESTALSALSARDAKSSRRTARLARQAMRADLALPCGMLVRELRKMLSAAGERRKADRTVPSVSSQYAREKLADATDEAPDAPPADDPARKPVR